MTPEQMCSLALVQALHVGVGVDAGGAGFVGFVELGGFGERDAVSEFAEGLGSGQAGDAGVEDAWGQGAGRLGGGDLNHIFSDIFSDILSTRRLGFSWFTPEDAG